MFSGCALGREVYGLKTPLGEGVAVREKVAAAVGFAADGTVAGWGGLSAGWGGEGGGEEEEEEGEEDWWCVHWCSWMWRVVVGKWRVVVLGGSMIMIMVMVGQNLGLQMVGD